MGDRSQDTDAGVNSGAATSDASRSQTANTASPPACNTPPTVPSKKTISYPDNSKNQPAVQEGSEPVDAATLAKALKDYDEAGRRERPSFKSPCRKRQRVYGDR